MKMKLYRMDKTIRSPMKKILCFLAVLIILLPAIVSVGCTARQNTPWDIAVLVKTRESDFFQTVRTGAEAASKEFNATISFYGPEKENEIDEQIEMLEQLIERKPDAILLAAADYYKLADAVKKAIDSGIPVITIDSGVDATGVSSVIETDNIAVGAKIGNAMAEAVGGRGKVLLINFVAGTSTAEARQQGFLDAVSAYSSIEIADIVFSNSQESLARELVLDYVAEDPEINIVVGLNAHSTIGAGRAILDLQQSNTADKIRLFGVDLTPEEVLHLDRGTLEATVIQNPYAMGYFGVQQAVGLLQTSKAEPLIYTDSVLINRENMYAPENQKLVFPLVE
ncbi:MAG: substrate-binding domain-containing protein [Clostridiaceae bacterium]|nr:substrate-binding domain-containing protein [Clostridiaceae bacterium]